MRLHTGHSIPNPHPWLHYYYPHSVLHHPSLPVLSFIKSPFIHQSLYVIHPVRLISCHPSLTMASLILPYISFPSFNHHSWIHLASFILPPRLISCHPYVIPPSYPHANLPHSSLNLSFPYSNIPHSLIPSSYSSYMAYLTSYFCYPSILSSFILPYISFPLLNLTHYPTNIIHPLRLILTPSFP